MGGKNLIKSNRKVILEGMRDGIPIGLGYLAVSFSLGIAAKTAGLNAFQSFLASLLCNASAGEYSGFTVIAADSSYFVIALATLVANARYLLMSCALSQRISKDTSIIHRLLLGFFVTDEFFGISISRSGKLNPFYTYGAILIGCPCWAFGSMLGTIAGNLLPLRIVSALSVALFGMFLASSFRRQERTKHFSELCLSALRQVLHLHIFPSSIRLTRVHAQLFLQS